MFRLSAPIRRVPPPMAAARAKAKPPCLLPAPPQPSSVLPSSLARKTSLPIDRSEEHTSELQSLMRISYAVFCLKKKTQSIKSNIYQCVQNTTVPTALTAVSIYTITTNLNDLPHTNTT